MKSGVLQKLQDLAQRVLFNLEGIDVWSAVSRVAPGKGGATDWELLQIQKGDFVNLEFWPGVQRAGNPLR